ncbi:MAG: D-alanyl-D-alanine carboxypeptidase/D-alanyl-D-alanine-endopeptidase [Ilumatobacter sp.]
MHDDPADIDEGRLGDDHIDVVAEPIRYRRSPLLFLVLAAALPAIGLLVLQRWADDEADRYEQTNSIGLFDVELNGEFVTSAERAAADGEGAQPSAVTTRLLDFRRSPATVAAAASADRLGVALEPVLGFLSDESCVTIAVDGVVVSELNPLLPVIPASTQKLLLAASALDVLGPDHRFTTSVAIPPIQDGVVDGDIFLVGGGDPVLTSSEFGGGGEGRVTTSFDAVADAIVAAGVTRIRGTVIGDGTRYDDEFFVDEWADDVPFIEAGPYDALLANDARVVGRSGVESDPNEAAARELVRLLNVRGVQVDNGWGSGAASNLVPVAVAVESAPLVEIVGDMLLTSDDNSAEMLLKEMGVATAQQGTRAAGLSAMADSLERNGVEMNGVRLRDGSGLSAENRVTCTAIADVLHLAADGPLASALPVANRTGTLADEFEGSPMAGRLTAKTGTLGNPPIGVEPPGVKALAGFVPPMPGSDAGTIEFAIIANQELITDETFYRPLWTAFGERFAAFPTGPDRESLGPR